MRLWAVKSSKTGAQFAHTGALAPMRNESNICRALWLRWRGLGLGLARVTYFGILGAREVKNQSIKKNRLWENGTGSRTASKDSGPVEQVFDCPGAPKSRSLKSDFICFSDSYHNAWWFCLTTEPIIANKCANSQFFPRVSRLVFIFKCIVLGEW